MSDDDESPPLLSRMVGRLFAENWEGAREVVRANDEAFCFPDFWYEFIDAWQLECTAEPQLALEKYSSIRQDLEEVSGGLHSEDEVDALIMAEIDLLMPLAESRGISLALRKGLVPSDEQQRLSDRLDELNAALWERSRSVAIENLKRRGIWDQMDMFHQALCLHTSLGAAGYEFGMILEAEPTLNRQPARLNTLWMQFASNAFHADTQRTGQTEVLPMLIRNMHDLAAFQLVMSNHAVDLLRDPRAQALHLRFCAAWRRGCTYERHFEIWETHVTRNGLMLNDFFSTRRHLYIASESHSTEERIIALCDALKTISERSYKQVLIALFRLEHDRDDLAKVPPTLNALMLQLADHPAWKESSELRSLVDPEFGIIRNAIAHESVHFQDDGRVIFVNTDGRNKETRTSAMTADQLEQRVEDLLSAYTVITNSFNYLHPPKSA